MQETRRKILDILKERSEATVDDIVGDLERLRGSITSVTVRHHLAKLQEEGLVDIHEMRHRSSPGRPQHVYALTEQGVSFFPNNYQVLANHLLSQLKQQLAPNQVNVIMEGVADNMAEDACIPNGTMHERLDAVVEYLNHHGYTASWDTHQNGYVLQTANCPYHHIAQENEMLCTMDMRLISKMLGVVPRLLSRVSGGDEICSYLIPTK
jgi:DeoR family transcriptional regulator, suf operon transcriptional repressor